MTLTRSLAVQFKKELEDAISRKYLNAFITPSVFNPYNRDTSKPEHGLVCLRVYNTRYYNLPLIFEIAEKYEEPKFFVQEGYIIFY